MSSPLLPFEDEGEKYPMSVKVDTTRVKVDTSRVKVDTTPSRNRENPWDEKPRASDRKDYSQISFEEEEYDDVSHLTSSPSPTRNRRGRGRSSARPSHPSHPSQPSLSSSPDPLDREFFHRSVGRNLDENPFTSRSLSADSGDSYDNLGSSQTPIHINTDFSTAAPPVPSAITPSPTDRLCVDNDIDVSNSNSNSWDISSRWSRAEDSPEAMLRESRLASARAVLEAAERVAKLERNQALDKTGERVLVLTLSDDEERSEDSTPYCELNSMLPSSSMLPPSHADDIRANALRMLNLADTISPTSSTIGNERLTSSLTSSDVMDQNFGIGESHSNDNIDDQYAIRYSNADKSNMQHINSQINQNDTTSAWSSRYSIQSHLPPSVLAAMASAQQPPFVEIQEDHQPLSATGMKRTSPYAALKETIERNIHLPKFKSKRRMDTLTEDGVVFANYWAKDGRSTKSSAKATPVEDDDDLLHRARLMELELSERSCSFPHPDSYHIDHRNSMDKDYPREDYKKRCTLFLMIVVLFSVAVGIIQGLRNKWTRQSQHNDNGIPTVVINAGTVLRKDITFHIMHAAPLTRHSSQLLAKQISHIVLNDDDNHPSSFFIHLGDVTDPSQSLCDSSAYHDAAAVIFSAHSKIKTLALPGEGDWKYCPRPADSWEDWTGAFLQNRPQDLHRDNLVIAERRQDSKNENFAFLYERVLFVGVNLLSDGGGNDDIEWLTDNLAFFKYHAVVVFGHVDPHTPKPALDTFFAKMRDVVREDADLMKLIYIHAGDTAVWENDGDFEVYAPFLDLDDRITAVRVHRAGGGDLFPPLRTTILGGGRDEVDVRFG